MQAKTNAVALLLAAFVMLVFQTLLVGSATKDCVPVEGVTALIFQKNEDIVSREGQSFRQLECVDGCDNSDIASVTCVKGDPNVDGVTAEWMCVSPDESHGKVFDELNIICEPCESQTGPCLVAGSCRLQYKLRSVPLQSDDVICSAASYVKQWGKDAAENIRNTINVLKEGVQECANGELTNCIRDASHLIGLSVTTSQGKTMWDYAKMAGSKVAKIVGWKTAATALTAVAVAGTAYSITYCSQDASSRDLATELSGQAHLKLL